MRLIIHDGETVINVTEIADGWSGAEGEWGPGPGHHAMPHETAQIGWQVVDGGPVAPEPAPPPSPETVKAGLRAHAANRRWQIETGGITVAGMEIPTDDRSKLMITGARIKADIDPGFTTPWKTSTGFMDINAATIIAISDAVLAHVNQCFACEAAVVEAIEAGGITTTQEIDAENWPG